MVDDDDDDDDDNHNNNNNNLSDTKLGLLVGKPDGKRPLERPRRRCEDNIKPSL
jgi:hypothetical protein